MPKLDLGPVVPKAHIATEVDAGIVKSSLAQMQGRVSVDTVTGLMTLNDWQWVREKISLLLALHGEDGGIAGEGSFYGLIKMQIGGDGILYMHYGDPNVVPPLFIDFDPNSATYGNLCVSYDDSGPEPPLYIDFDPTSETYGQLILEVESQ